MEQETNSSGMDVTGVSMAFAAVLIWAGNYIAARGVADAVPALTLSCWRWAVAALVFLPFARKNFSADWPVLKRHPWYLFITAFLGLGFFSVGLYTAAHSTEALNMALFSTTSPIFTLLLARIFLREKLTARRVFGIVAALFGVLLLTVRGDFFALTTLTFYRGDLLVLASAISFAGYTVLLRFKPKGASDNGFSLCTFILAFAMLLPFSIWELATGTEIRFSVKSCGEFAYIGICASVVAYWCWNGATRRIGAANTSVIYYSIPLFSGILAVLFLNEPVSWVHFASGGLILTGIVVAARP